MWNYWQQEWILGEKVDFDGINKLIFVHPEVTSLNVRDDLYKAWVRWLPLQHNTQFLPAMRYTGFDPIPGGYTGDTYFLANGWKLVIDITKVKVDGLLFSDTADTAYYTSNLVPVYPAKVSSLFSVIAPTVNVSGLSVPTVVQIRQEIDTNSVRLAEIKILIQQLISDELVNLIASLPTATETAVEVANTLHTSIIPVNVKKMNDANVYGSGVEIDKWRGNV